MMMMMMIRVKRSNRCSFGVPPRVFETGWQFVLLDTRLYLVPKVSRARE
jgi:hypothetical protein